MDIFTERKTILVDTDAFVALYNKEDANHKIAHKISTSIVENKIQPLISIFSYSESITVISQKVSHEHAVTYIEDVNKGSAHLVEAIPNLVREGEDIFRKQTSKNVYFTDCFNMAIMEDYGIKEIFSFDEDYRKNGFKRVGID